MAAIIVYPAGAGGQWIRHLIHCLETNTPVSDMSNNFHVAQQTTSFFINHASVVNGTFKPSSTNYKSNNLTEFEKVSFNHKLDIHKRIGDPTKHNCYWFNGTALFNMFLNAAKKVPRPDRELSLTDRFELMTCDASSKLEDYLNQPVDLDYNSLYVDTEKFTIELYTMLDKENIIYQKSNALVLDGIDKFKQTCVDTTAHFNNFESEMWLAWCMGIIKYQGHQWIMINSIADAQEFLYNNRQMFCDFTLDKFIA